MSKGWHRCPICKCKMHYFYGFWSCQRWDKHPWILYATNEYYEALVWVCNDSETGKQTPGYCMSPGCMEAVRTSTKCRQVGISQANELKQCEHGHAETLTVAARGLWNRRRFGRDEPDPPLDTITIKPCCWVCEHRYDVNEWEQACGKTAVDLTKDKSFDPMFCEGQLFELREELRK